MILSGPLIDRTLQNFDLIRPIVMFCVNSKFDFEFSQDCTLDKKYSQYKTAIDPKF